MERPYQNGQKAIQHNGILFLHLAHPRSSHNFYRGARGTVDFLYRTGHVNLKDGKPKLNPTLMQSRTPRFIFVAWPSMANVPIDGRWMKHCILVSFPSWISQQAIKGLALLEHKARTSFGTSLVVTLLSCSVFPLLFTVYIILPVD